MSLVTKASLQRFFTGLKDRFAPKNHTHDGRYYTESEIDGKLSGKANSSHTHTKAQVGLGNVDNTADSAKSVKYATSAGFAESATKANRVADYNATSKSIQIGYSGDGITGDAIKYIAGYTTGDGGDVSAKIKDISKDALKGWIGSLPANGGNATTVNGHSVNSDVPAGAKFTDTNTWRDVIDTLASTATDKSLSANQGKVLKGLVDGKAAASHTHTKAQITDFPSSLPASDVYSWAKASAKPNYSWGEITGKPSTFTPSGHSHNAFGKATADAAGSAGFVPGPLRTFQRPALNTIAFCAGFGVETPTASLA